MSKSDDHFDAFDDHTLLKHRILEAYLKSWAFKLLGRRDAGDSVFYVDCFAGEGRDGEGNSGSPTIACKAAIQVRERLTASGKAGKGMAVFAIEQKRRRFRKLVEYLEPFRAASPDGVMVLHGEVADHMPAIEARVGQQPVLFFLDPFGVGGLDASCYPAMLSGPQNEIFALFHDMGALRLRGILHAESDLNEQIARIRSQPSLFADEDAVIAHVVAKEGRRQFFLDRNEPAARRNISRALGDESWIEELEGIPNDEAREILLVKFIAALLRAGGANAVILPMRGASGEHKYCLVHVSKSKAGYVAMKEAISEGLNDPAFPGEMRDAMKRDLRLSMPTLLADLQRKFGGQTVRWTRDPKEVNVQWWLVADTDLFPFQLAELKLELEALKWIRRLPRREYCVMPQI